MNNNITYQDIPTISYEETDLEKTQLNLTVSELEQLIREKEMELNSLKNELQNKLDDLEEN